MFFVQKELEISSAHSIRTSKNGKCEKLHGHNWQVIVHCKSQNLNNEGMVTDFTEIKKIVHEKLDHQNLNEILDFNPTTENIAKWICDNVPNCYKVEIKESNNNKAIYEK